MKVTTQSAPILNLLIRAWFHLERRRQRQIGLLIGLMLISAFAEIISMSTVLPFLGIIAAPDHVFNHPVMTDLVLILGINSADQLVLPLTIAFGTAALMSGAIRILLLWANTRIAFDIGADFGSDMYYRTLCQPYQVHVSRNSSQVISGIINKVNEVVGVLLACLTLTSSAVLLIAILATLVIINPIFSMLATVGFGASYGLITWISRHSLHRNSHRIAHEQTQVIKALQEGLGGIRDVLLNGSQLVYYNIYRQADHHLRRAQGNNIFIGGSPRPAMEALGLVIIATLTFVLSRQVGGIAIVLPVLGALALGAQRLLPVLQQIYSAWSSIVGNQASLADAIELLEQPLSEEMLQPISAPLTFQKNILLRNVFFRYTNDAPWVLSGLNLEIPKGARVGFVGSTGSGKSTTLDLIMGLLLPIKGEILVDGQPISGNHLKAWQRSIAHVPQSIYLTDGTLAENIAFGVPTEAIDMDRVKRAARQAQIADFIESSKCGYHALVGERGIRLSGGQRQRIGIARALYKQASVLVFDEATSALDNATEQAVMDAIDGLSSDLTILLIAHRLTTLRCCDTIFELERGNVVAQGAYGNLFDGGT